METLFTELGEKQEFTVLVVFLLVTGFSGYILLNSSPELGL